MADRAYGGPAARLGALEAAMELERSRLFDVAPSHIYLACHYDWRTGWGLRVTTPGNEPGTTATRDYDGLSHPELIDVVDSELERVLGLRDAQR